MTTLSTAIAEGTLAARPAFGIKGRLYFTTDTRQVFRDIATGWDDVTPAGGRFVEEEVVAFTGVNGTFANVPTKIVGLFRNGERQQKHNASRADYFTIAGANITLATAAGGSDDFVAVYFY